VPAPPRRLRRRLWLAVAAIPLASAVAIGYVAWPRPVASGAARALRLTVQPPSGVRLTEPVAAPGLAVSPDGLWMAFHGVSDDPNKSGLYLRSASDLEPRLVIGGPVATFSPFFSPDSQWLGYGMDGAIWKMHVTGGEAVRICEACGAQASWADDGTIVLTARMAGYGAFPIVEGSRSC
jgi:hypothetical protein